MPAVEGMTSERRATSSWIRECAPHVILAALAGMGLRSCVEYVHANFGGIGLAAACIGVTIACAALYMPEAEAFRDGLAAGTIQITRCSAEGSTSLAPQSHDQSVPARAADGNPLHDGGQCSRKPSPEHDTPAADDCAREQRCVWNPVGLDGAEDQGRCDFDVQHEQRCMQALAEQAKAAPPSDDCQAASNSIDPGKEQVAHVMSNTPKSAENWEHEPSDKGITADDAEAAKDVPKEEGRTVRQKLVVVSNLDAGAEFFVPLSEAETAQTTVGSACGLDAKTARLEKPSGDKGGDAEDRSRQRTRPRRSVRTVSPNAPAVESLSKSEKRLGDASKLIERAACPVDDRGDEGSLFQKKAGFDPLLEKEAKADFASLFEQEVKALSKLSSQLAWPPPGDDGDWASKPVDLASYHHMMAMQHDAAYMRAMGAGWPMDAVGGHPMFLSSPMMGPVVPMFPSQPPQHRRRWPGQERSSTPHTTMGDVMKSLEHVAASQVLVVRRIKHLGFNSAQLLQKHFAQFGAIDRVLVSHSHVQNRIRPACLAFVVTSTPSVAARALEAGTMHFVRGTISVSPFEHASDHRGPLEQEQG